MRGHNYIKKKEQARPKPDSNEYRGTLDNLENVDQILLAVQILRRCGNDF